MTLASVYKGCGPVSELERDHDAIEIEQFEDDFDIQEDTEQIVETAIQEDADCVAMSILSGAHNHLFPKVVNLLKERGADDILVVGGGVIPEDDIPGLIEAGVAGIFTPGTPTSVTIDFIKNNIKRK